MQFGADPLGALPHSGQTPVLFASELQNVFVDAGPIVTHQELKLPWQIAQFSLYMRGLGMPKRVQDGFAADAIDLVAQQGVQRAWIAFHHHPKLRLMGACP